MIGSVPHREVQVHLAACDILSFLQFAEFGGGVILESMAVGVVPMAVDYAGPSELMTESSSFRIPLGTREEIIQRFRSELERLIADPEEIDRRSTAAMARVIHTSHGNARQSNHWQCMNGFWDSAREAFV